MASEQQSGVASAHPGAVVSADLKALDQSNVITTTEPVIPVSIQMAAEGGETDGTDTEAAGDEH